MLGILKSDMPTMAVPGFVVVGKRRVFDTGLGVERCRNCGTSAIDRRLMGPLLVLFLTLLPMLIFAVVRAAILRRPRRGNVTIEVKAMHESEPGPTPLEPMTEEEFEKFQEELRRKRRVRADVPGMGWWGMSERETPNGCVAGFLSVWLAAVLVIVLVSILVRWF